MTNSTDEWTCEHGAVRAEGCREFACGGDGYVEREGMTVAERREWNRREMEARYQDHLRLGPDLCQCGLCRRAREATA